MKSSFIIALSVVLVFGSGQVAATDASRAQSYQPGTSTAVSDRAGPAGLVIWDVDKKTAVASAATVRHHYARWVHGRAIANCSTRMKVTGLELGDRLQLAESAVKMHSAMAHGDLYGYDMSETRLKCWGI